MKHQPEPSSVFLENPDLGTRKRSKDGIAANSQFGVFEHYGHRTLALRTPMAKRTSRNQILGALTVLGGMAALWPIHLAAQDSSERLRHVQTQIAEGSFAEAAELAASLDDSLDGSPTNVDLSLPLAQIARGFQNKGEPEKAAEFFQRSLAALDRPAATSLPPETICVVQLAAASAFVHVGLLDDASVLLTKLFSNASSLSDSQIQLGVAICLRVGADALTKQNHAVAENAYLLAATHGEAEQKSTAILGAAWAVAVSGDRPVEAAKMMIDFLDKFPDHRDASRASQAGISCLAQSGTASDDDVWDRLVFSLGKTDVTGRATADLLNGLNKSGDAERLATFLLAPPKNAELGEVVICSAARESACRWAGRHQRWSMLALASQSTSPQTEDANRTEAIERLFAEALMQTGRREEAHLWWTHLADDRKASDFATLIRCAETEVSIGETELAMKRVDAARLAAGEDRYRISLVAMLSAELAIRRLRFDDARSDLESVVRSSEVAASLRGRAQWMIGETFFLQQKFAEAIEAYRAVAGIDSEGEWVAASLVQAGKSFEQLGRTRDAAICYSTLVSRHAESEYASLASRRLAALSVSDTTNPANLGSPSKPNKPILRR